MMETEYEMYRMDVPVHYPKENNEELDEDDCYSLFHNGTDETTPLTVRVSRICCSGITPWLLVTSIVCVLGSSFQFGYNMAVVNAPEQVIRTYFTEHNVTMNDFIWSTAVSVTAVGGMIGALVGAGMADIYGRKSIILWNNAIIIFGCIFIFLSRLTKSPALLIIGRFIVGINNGIVSVVIPMFLSEIAPTHLRGAISGLNQVGIVTGILLANILGLHQVLGTSSCWGYLMSFSVIPSIIQVFILPFCPSSPRYLLIKLNKEADAKQELIKLQSDYNIHEVIKEMKVEKEDQTREKYLSMWQLLRSKPLRFSLAVCSMLHTMQQLSGINTVLYYSTSIFKKTHISEPDVASCGIGVISVIICLTVAIFTDKLGRRLFMLIGLAGMFFAYGFITVGFTLEDKYENMKYLSLVCTFLLVLFFQLGPGTITFIITPELFAQGPRAAGLSICGAINWFFNFIVAISFPLIQKWLGPYVFVVFMVLVFGFWFFMYLYLPETKNRTFEEITKSLQSNTEFQSRNTYANN